MLTTEAFNALLKTLEEPPDHVFFMFATTELHKIPITILSRCQRYELKRVSFAELQNFFRKIADRENVKISDRALAIISREADGSVRDGLSLLDQMFSFGGSEVRDEDIVQVLGLVDHSVFEKLAKGLLAADLAQSLELLEQTYRAGIDLKRFANDLLLYFRTLLICKTSSQPAEMLDISDMELSAAKEIAAASTPETLYQYFQFLLKAIAEMRYSAHPRLILEMAFIKAAQNGEIVPAQTLLTRLDELLSQGGITLPKKETKKNEPQQKTGSEKTKTSSLEPGKPRESRPGEAEEQKKEQKLETKEKTIDPPLEPVKQKDPAPPSIKNKNPEPVLSSGQTKNVRLHWDEFTVYVKERKTWMAHILQICDKVEEKDNDLILKFLQDTDCVMLRQGDNLKFLARYAQDFFQKELKIKIMVRGNQNNSKNDDDTIRAERRALANDPLVQTAAEIFGGRVVSVRTGPRFR
jgi:DNA polymerase-3 subunit gamma/tau